MFPNTTKIVKQTLDILLMSLIICVAFHTTIIHAEKIELNESTVEEVYQEENPESEIINDNIDERLTLSTNETDEEYDEPIYQNSNNTQAESFLEPEISVNNDAKQIISVNNEDQQLSGEIKTENEIPANVYGQFKSINNDELSQLTNSLNLYLAEHNQEIDTCLLSLDIGFYNSDESKFIITGDSTVKLYIDWEILNSAQLFHLKNDGTWENIIYTMYAASDTSPRYIEFETKSFSPFLFIKTIDIKENKIQDQYDTSSELEDVESIDENIENIENISKNKLKAINNKTLLGADGQNDEKLPLSSYIYLVKEIWGDGVHKFGETTSEFKVRLYQDDEGLQVPLSGYTITVAGEEYTTDENGEFIFPLTVNVTGTSYNSANVTFYIPSPCNYEITEINTDYPAYKSTTIPSNSSGYMSQNSGTGVYFQCKLGAILLTPSINVNTDYPEYMPTFPFEIKLEKNGEPISGTFQSVGLANNVTFEDGKTVIPMKPAVTGNGTHAVGDYILIFEIPEQTNFKVNFTEEFRNKYSHDCADFLFNCRDYNGNIIDGIWSVNYFYNFGNYGTKFYNGDQYFYFHDTTEKVDNISYYFSSHSGDYNFHDVPMSYDYKPDGTKVYYYDPDGNENEIIVHNDERVVCVLFPRGSVENIGCRYKPVDYVRIWDFVGTTNIIDDGQRLDASHSWDDSEERRGTLVVAAEEYGLKSFHKAAPGVNKVDATFELFLSRHFQNKVKLILDHYDTYEYKGEIYSNVYIANGESVAIDVEDERSTIHTDENGNFNILYPRMIESSKSIDPVFKTDGNESFGGNYEIKEKECDNNYFIGKDSWKSSTSEPTLKLRDYLYYNGQHLNSGWMLQTKTDVTTFDYNKLSYDNAEVLIAKMDLYNGIWPVISKRIEAYESQNYKNTDFWFDVKNESGEIIKSFTLKDGESFILSPENVPGLTAEKLRNGKIFIDERKTDNWNKRIESEYIWRAGQYGYYLGDGITDKLLDITFINKAYPSVIKKVKGPYNSDEEFWFDVYKCHRNADEELVASFSLKNNEFFQMNAENIPGFYYQYLSDYYDGYHIVERKKEGWTSTYNFNRWNSRSVSSNDMIYTNSRLLKNLSIKKSFTETQNKNSIVKFKISLWDDNDGIKHPIKNFTVYTDDTEPVFDENNQTSSMSSIVTNANGECIVEVIVPSGSESGIENFWIPSHCHYKIEEISCNLPGVRQISKTNEVGIITEDITSEWVNEVIPSYDVIISKQDIHGQELAGASLKITGRETGATSDIEPISWVSGSDGYENGTNQPSLKPHTVQLAPGNYTLHEDTPPTGYKIALDINFIVDEEGKIKVNNKIVSKIIMKDFPIDSGIHLHTGGTGRASLYLMGSLIGLFISIIAIRRKTKKI